MTEKEIDCFGLQPSKDEHIHVVRPVGLSAFWVFIQKAPILQRPKFAPIQPGASIPFMLNQEPSRAVTSMDEHIHVVRPVGPSAFWVLRTTE